MPDQDITASISTLHPAVTLSYHPCTTGLPNNRQEGPRVHSTNLFNTLILASSDCGATEGTTPTKAGTIAAIEHEMITAAPYGMTSDELLFAVEVRRKNVKAGKLAEFRKEFFSKPHACLRASPLVKSYGWGIHSDADGKVALVGRETDRYRTLVANLDVEKVAGMRSRRA
jgi:Family of unknown function (DUF6157)